MSLLRELKRRARQVVGPVVGISAVVYFSYHAIQGDRGFLALGALEREVAGLQQRLDGLQSERQGLEARVQLLRPDSLDPDMLEERVRLVLGFGHGDEMVVMFPRDSAAAAKLVERLQD